MKQKSFFCACFIAFVKGLRRYSGQFSLLRFFAAKEMKKNLTYLNNQHIA